MESPRTVAITGASGLVGKALTQAYESDGVRVLRLVRRAPVSGDEVRWDPATGEIDSDSLEGVDVVYHLAGKGIADERWTRAVKEQIVRSRVEGSGLIARTLAGLDHEPRTLVTASAIGFYGDRGDEPVNEESPAGDGFLAETCQQWERAGAPAWEAGIRVVQARIGIVLSRDGGALAEMLPIFSVGAGGVIGSGNQFMSWIALPDLVRVLRFIGEVESTHGAVNATAPNPVTNRDFTKALGAKLGRPTFFPTPVFMLKFVKGEMVGPLLLEGAKVLPQRLEEAGFVFDHPTLESALDKVLA